jgi:hypothetical protein
VARMRTESRRRGVENIDIVEGRFEDFRFDGMFDVILLPFKTQGALEARGNGRGSRLAVDLEGFEDEWCVHVDEGALCPASARPSRGSSALISPRGPASKGPGIAALLRGP